MSHTTPSGNVFVERFIVEPKTQNVWGINHSIWFVFMGIAGALFLNRVFFGIELGRVFGLVVADVISMILISIGGLILIADLGKPLRFLRALIHVRHSWIAVGAVADFTFLFVETLFIMPDFKIAGSQPFAWMPWGAGTPLGVALQVIASTAALIVIVYPGFVLAASASIPFWNTALIPMHYLAYAFAGGGAIVFLVGPLASSADLAAARAVTLVATSVTLVLMVSHVLEGYYRCSTARESALELVWRGSLSGYFVTGVLLLGLVLPGVLLLVAPNPGSGSWLALAAVLLLAGNWLSKYTVLKVGKYEAVF